jgi:hypothetical protein
MKKGLFREHGLIIKPVIRPNQASVAALVQKEIPYITNLRRVLSGAGRGFPIKQIMVLAGKTSRARNLAGHRLASRLARQHGSGEPTWHHGALRATRDPEKYDLDPTGAVDRSGLRLEQGRGAETEARRCDYDRRAL